MKRIAIAILLIVACANAFSQSSGWSRKGKTIQPTSVNDRVFIGTRDTTSYDDPMINMRTFTTAPTGNRYVSRSIANINTSTPITVRIAGSLGQGLSAYGSTGALTWLVGNYGLTENYGSTFVTNMVSNLSYAGHRVADTVQYLSGFDHTLLLDSGGVVLRNYGVIVRSPIVSTGHVDINYGMFIQSQVNGNFGDSYSIYQEGASQNVFQAGHNYFSGTLDVTGDIDGTARIADTSAFSGSATRKAVYISGVTTQDKFVVSERGLAGDEVLPVADNLLKAVAKADSLIVLRAAGTTTNLKFTYIRVR